jgi:hypothetical protein
MLDFERQGKIVETAHTGIGWLLIPHAGKEREDYQRARVKLLKAAEMIGEVLSEGAEPQA